MMDVIYGEVINQKEFEKSLQPPKEISLKYQMYIGAVTKWIGENFYFNNGVVHYLHPEKKELTKFDNEMCIEDEMIYDKRSFKNPENHLIYNILIIGKHIESEEAVKALNEMARSANYDSSY